MQQLIALMLFGYFCGSIPAGKLLGYLRGIDIQKQGSGNIGFANAVRVLGWPLGLCVLCFDIGKGVVPVLVAAHYFDTSGQLVVALAAVGGHVYPLWLKFRGGKGVATGFGVLLVLSPPIALASLGCYCLTFAISRTSGLSSITAAWSLLPSSWLIDAQLFWFCCLLGALATYTHRQNIRNLIAQPDMSKL